MAAERLSGLRAFWADDMSLALLAELLEVTEAR